MANKHRSILQCKMKIAAMQTNGLLLVSGIRRLGLGKRHCNSIPAKGHPMSKTASLGFAPSATFFSRLMVNIDRLLMASARIAIRNGDLPYFGL
jgi:hypothetical protein